MQEYALLAGSITLKPGYEKLSSAELMDSLMPALNKLMESFNRPPVPFQGQEVLSHNVIQVGSTLLLTILVRHPKT